MLAIARAAPEHQPVAELLLQPHAGPCPWRVVCTGLRMSTPISISVGMKLKIAPSLCMKTFICVLAVDPVQPALVVGHDPLAEHAHAKGTGASCVPRSSLNWTISHAVAHRRGEPPQVLQPGLGQPLVAARDVIGLGGQGDHPGLEIARAQAEEQLVGRAHRGDDRQIGVLPQGLGRGVQMVAFLRRVSSGSSSVSGSACAAPGYLSSRSK